MLIITGTGESQKGH